jgi:penicillin amidase
LAKLDGEIVLRGLTGSVTVVRDRWGIPHIYAGTTEDLFFAQGFVAAQDRLWQMEMWRRSKEGRLAEVLGPDAVERDRVARLLRYRGPMNDTEWKSYHPDAKRIVTAFVAGVNAFIAQGETSLPVEFHLTGIRPSPWTPEVPLLRAISFGDAAAELRRARDIASLGLAEANRRHATDPPSELVIPRGLDLSIIDDAVIASTETVPAGAVTREPGSNNWVVNGRLSATRRPIVANDPHREVTVPSLRYLVHLNAPGWNVIGAGEPAVPGVAIGHNGQIAWGLTIVGTDQHDVYVEELDPANRGMVRWRGGWEPLRLVRETISVKGEASRTVTLLYSRHGPIFHVDSARLRAYALRSALHEPGTAPYLGSLRVNQAANCRTFLDAVMYWKAPSENMICGDVRGDISWQASALTPRRQGWLGRIPVPGSGEYEWAGFRTDLPREMNPARGFIATANNNIHAPGYASPVMFKDTEPSWRITRLRDVLSQGGRFSVGDFQQLQLDEFSEEASRDSVLFRDWTALTTPIERARVMVANWDRYLRRDSAPAAIYMAWRAAGGAGPAARLGASKTIRDSTVAANLERAIDALTREQGADWEEWRWGRSNVQAFPHPFVSAFDLPAVERGGGGETVAANGATYRQIIDVGDWDKSVVTSVPGQSGQPGSPFYDNLLRLWAENQYFPLLYSRAAVNGAAAHRLVLKPR